MKKKELLASMLLICLFGIFVTFQVRQFVDRNGQEASGALKSAREYAERSGELSPETGERTADAAFFSVPGTETEEDMKIVPDREEDVLSESLQQEEPPLELQEEPADSENEPAYQEQESGKIPSPLHQADQTGTQAQSAPSSQGSGPARAEDSAVSVAEGDAAPASDPAAPAQPSEPAMAFRSAVKAEEKKSGQEPDIGALDAEASAKAGAAGETRSETRVFSSASEETKPDKAAQPRTKGVQGTAPARTAGTLAETTAKEEMTEQGYRRALEDIASQIEKLKNSETNTTTWSYLNLADYELKLWDDKLNEIYKDVMGRLSQEEAEELKKEELAWIRKKEEDARKAASRYKGGSQEGLEHTASLAKSTKDRAYELLDAYGDILPQEEQEQKEEASHD